MESAIARAEAEAQAAAAPHNGNVDPTKPAPGLHRHHVGTWDWQTSQTVAQSQELAAVPGIADQISIISELVDDGVSITAALKLAYDHGARKFHFPHSSIVDIIQANR